jgi:hypothetical protein
MNTPRTYCQAVARAIRQLDQFSLRGPEIGPDKHDWDEARRRLINILDRNGFELAGQRIKRTNTRKA